MKIGSIGRSLVRYFTKRATELTPKKQPLGEAPIESIIDGLRKSGVLPADAEVRVIERPGIQPPAEMTWAQWNALRDQSNAPKGWSFCRFANRLGRDRMGLVFGVVRGNFGVWRTVMPVCSWDESDLNAGAKRNDTAMTCLTYLPSGLGLGIFAEHADAFHACDIAERMAGDWPAPSADDFVGIQFFGDTVREGWMIAGLRPSSWRHAHIGGSAADEALIWERGPEQHQAPATRSGLS